MSRERAAGTLTLGVLLLVLIRTAGAQQLPFRRYGVADGLPNGSVTAIHQDSKGFLWVGTRAGICRFDGERFITLDSRSGLPHPLINAIAEDKAGRIWVGTNGGGLASISPDHGMRIAAFRIDSRPGSERVNSLAFDRLGHLWCATDAGLYKGILVDEGPPQMTAIVAHPETAGLMPVLKDPDGSLWFGIFHEVIHVDGDSVERIPTPVGAAFDEVTGLVRDSSGRLLAGFGASVSALEGSEVKRSGFTKGFTPALFPISLPAGQKIYQMLSGPKGTIWIASRRGLLKWQGSGVATYGSLNGLGSDLLFSLANDREGNLWIGTQNAGLVRLSIDSGVRYTAREGLPEDSVAAVVPTGDGSATLSLLNGGLAELHGDRVVRVSGSDRPPFNRTSLRLARDGRKCWWLGTDSALFRVDGPSVDLARAERIRSEEENDILLVEAPFHLDPAGDLWASSRDGTVWRFPSGASRPVAAFRNPPVSGDDSLGRLLMTRSGVLWVATARRFGRISGTRFEPVETGVSFSQTPVRALLQDSVGRLWVGLRNGGLLTAPDPESAAPRFAPVGRRGELSSTSVLSLAEGVRGEVLAGTERGIDVCDPRGLLRHLGAANGVPETRVTMLAKETSGPLWAATADGVVRLASTGAGPARLPAPVYLRRISIADEARPRLENGSLRSMDLSLPPSPSLSIEWTGVSLSDAGALHYQFALEEVDKAWSGPTTERSVSYVRLPAGRYRFRVRAVTPDGLVSEEPAVLSLSVPPPVWRRLWFLSLVALGLGLVARVVYRARIERLLAVERIRTRIASDLHDDVGSSLSRIAVLSDAARRVSGEIDSEVGERLDRIAEISRELVDTMSDIVWAVNPARDRLRDLSQRMRRFAEDLLGAAGLELSLSLPSPEEDVPISADVRREVLMIFKEAVHNVLRHAGARSVAIRVERVGGRILLSVKDDGCGFETGAPREGNGLSNIALRSARLGGTLVILSTKGEGSEVRLTSPLRPANAARKSPGDQRDSGS